MTYSSSSAKTLNMPSSGIGCGYTKKRVVVEVMVPPLLLVGPPPMPELGILGVLTEEEE